MTVKVLGVEFAPLNIPWERRMQTFAVASWILTFFLMGPAGWILLLYTFLYTRFWPLPLVYLAWYIYDSDQCNRGGRRLEWVRKWRLWKRYCEYFPIKLVKTEDLPQDKNYLFAVHPHGILCSGAFGNFATEGTNFSQMFPGVTPHMLALEGHFSFPFYREYLMCSGSCSASKSSINYILSRPSGGHAAVLVVGGAAESLDSHPGSYVLQLKRRKGFIRMALTHGASIVPVFSFGETNIYDQLKNPEGSFIRKVQNKLRKAMGLAPCVILGRGVFQYSFGIIPQRRPITTVVGSPICAPKMAHPTESEVDSFHQKYIEAITNLFHTHKEEYAEPNAKLVIN